MGWPYFCRCAPTVAPTDILIGYGFLTRTIIQKISLSSHTWLALNHGFASVLLIYILFYHRGIHRGPLCVCVCMCVSLCVRARWVYFENCFQTRRGLIAKVSFPLVSLLDTNMFPTIYTGKESDSFQSDCANVAVFDFVNV